MAVNTRRTPERNNPFFSGKIIEKITVTDNELTTAGGAETMTVAEVLGGLLVAATEDAQTWTTPTAAQLRAAIPDCAAGDSFTLEIINSGDSTLTVGLGTGITAPSSSGTSSVLTIATVTAKIYRFVCVSVLDAFVPGSSDAWYCFCISASSAVYA